MSLNKELLKTDLRSLYDSTLSSNGNEADSKEAFISGLADAIDSYIKTANITYSGGLTSPNGAVAGIFNNTIS